MQGNRKVLLAAACIVAGALLLILFLFNPINASFYPPCPLRLATKLYCPGCGSLRATHALLHGRIGEAFSLNPLWVLLIPVLAWISIPRFRPKNAWFPWMLFWIVMVFGVLRNLPWWPMTLLAP